MTGLSSSPREALDRLKSAYHALLICHRNPDGDAIGSELGLVELARRLGVRAGILNRDATPANLSQLPGIDDVRVADGLPDDFSERFDLVVTVECPGLDRTGFDGLTRLPILNIDHHPSNEAFGEVNYLDAEIGRLDDGLAARGLVDDTVLVLTADHGEGLGEHGEETHALMVYNSTAHVPLILKAPGLEPKRVGGTVRTTDILPTVCDLLGLETPAEVQGTSLVPFMAALYVGSAFIVLVLHIDHVPSTLALIVTSASRPMPAHSRK